MAQPDPSSRDPLQATVSDWIEGLRDGDERSAEELWQRYFQRLVHLAEKRLPSALKRIVDGEDVALSAFHSLCAGIHAGRFPALRSRDDLWSLLIVVTARKSLKKQRAESTLKRGAMARDDGAAIAAIAGREPSPEFAAAVADETEHLIAALPDAPLRALARGRLEGYTHAELARQQGCTVRTVERRLALVRSLWMQGDAE